MIAYERLLFCSSTIIGLIIVAGGLSNIAFLVLVVHRLQARRDTYNDLLVKLPSLRSSHINTQSAD